MVFLFFCAGTLAYFGLRGYARNLARIEDLVTSAEALLTLFFGFCVVTSLDRLSRELGGRDGE